MLTFSSLFVSLCNIAQLKYQHSNEGYTLVLPTHVTDCDRSACGKYCENMAPVYIRNELLAFVFNKKDVDHEFDRDRTLYRFYNEDAVKHAKLELWKHYKDNMPKWEDRKNRTKTCKEKEIKDILQGVKAIDEAFS